MNTAYYSFVLTFLSFVGFAQKEYGNSITKEELKSHLYIYASDEFEGREAGTEGEKKAITFLSDYYQSIGVAPGNSDGTYFQHMKLRVDRKNIESTNVLAFIKGSEKPEEVLVITAHLDHVGKSRSGQVYNGADDDGSGTVAMLEVAEAFQKAVLDGKGPKRSILFLHVSAEEKGLLGSNYYTSYPVYPLDNTVVNLNIDMIGRVDDFHKDNPNYVYLIGSDILSKDLHEISEEMNAKYTQIELDYRYNDPTTIVNEFGRNTANCYYYRSDHYNFARHEIPVIFYFNGTHEDYHQPTDTIEKINFDMLERRSRLIFYTTWELANRKERIRLKSDINRIVENDCKAYDR